jgi:hypothetical protein
MEIIDLENFRDHIVTWLHQAIQSLTTLPAVIQAAAAFLGLIFAITQLRGATQDRLYTHYTEICKLFMQNPDLRPYFYENEADRPRQTEEEYKQTLPKIGFMCEAILGLVEHAVLQKRNMPGDAWNHCWRPYALERLKQSKALQEFFKPNSPWYSQRMCREMEKNPPHKVAARRRDHWWMPSRHSRGLKQEMG